MDSIERFINYCKIDTQADDTTGLTPSTEKQKNLGVLLVKELKELGLNDAMMDEHGNVYAHLKGEGDKVGFNAHMDTALEVTDTGVNPKIVKNFIGDPIKLNDKYMLTVKEFPGLAKHFGKDLIVTDGNTLLGADDKAGIAIIMSALEYLKEHPEMPHQNISVAFTVDEEIGEGTKFFDYERMNADYAYTIDGADISEINDENFNAQACELKVEGVSVHPGEGKNTLINAMLIIADFVNMLPKGTTPFEAGPDDGYWHINSINGTNDSGTLDMILRDFDYKKLTELDEKILAIVEKLKDKYPTAKINVSIREQYSNMKPFVEKYHKPVRRAEEALMRNGITPKMTKIRGGTDGATMSKNGLVTPNLGTGSFNHHGRYEYLVVQDFNKMIDVVIDLMRGK